MQRETCSVVRLPASPWIPVAVAALLVVGQWSWDSWLRRESAGQPRIISEPPGQVYLAVATPSGVQRIRRGTTHRALFPRRPGATDLHYEISAPGYRTLTVGARELLGQERFPARGSLRLAPLSPWAPLLRAPGYVLALIAVAWAGARGWRLRRRRREHQDRLRALETNRLEAGLSIGPYRVLGPLGRGGMAQVVEVELPGSTAARALKLLEPGLEAESRARFEREARLSLSLQHPNLVAFYDFGEFAGRFYLVMERIQGSTLEVAWQDRDLRTRLSWLAQVADALQALHDRQILHRDVKPSNIMVDRTGKALLMDFGIARSLAETPLTGGGQVLGTAGFMAPEQIMGEALDHRSDLYALGMLIYLACSGRLAFSARAAAELIVQQVSQEPEELAGLRPDLPADFCAWVMSLLARRPAQRPDSAQAVSRELRAWMERNSF